MNYLSIITLMVVAIFSLSACNTIKGAGQDIEAAGDKIEDAASQNTTY